MHKLNSIKDISITNKTILYFAPYDIGTKLINNKYVLSDDSRMIATIPTLKKLIDGKNKIAILTWVKRPENGFDPSLSTNTHAIRLSELIERPVKHLPDCVGETVKKEIYEMKESEIIMLENTRFHKEDSIEDKNFAKKITEGFDLIVFDGFPQAHRKVSSTTGILKILPSYAGLYFESEYENLNGLLDNPNHPFTLIIGGAKISDKVEAINNLSKNVESILLGGGPANIYLKSKNKDIQNSIYESVEINPEIFEKVANISDVIVADNIKNPLKHKIINFSTDEIPTGWSILDIGPRTAKTYSEIISKSKTVFWAGPIGLFENQLFENGTKSVVKSICNNNKTTIVAGGDTVAALNQFGSTTKVKHISLAGGATLEFLSGKNLEVIDLLKK